MINLLSPGLHIVATPIGNLGDLARAPPKHFADPPNFAEDTRVTAKLLQHIGAKVPMSRYDDHLSERPRNRLSRSLAKMRSLS